MNPSPKVPTANAPIAIAFRHIESRCQRESATTSSEVSSSPRRCLRSAPPAHRSEVQVVEDLGFGHGNECIAPPPDPAWRRDVPASLDSAMTGRAIHLSDLHRGARVSDEVDAALVEAVRRLAPTVVVATGDLANRGRAGEMRRARALLDTLGAPWLAVPGNHDLPYGVPARFVSPGRVFEREIGSRAPRFASPEIVVQGVDSSWPWRHQGGRLTRAHLARVAGAFADAAPGALRVVALHHHLAGAPWRAARKLPLRHRDRALEAFLEAGAELVLGGHIHQSTAVRTSDVRPARGGAGRELVLTTAPGLGRPRPHRQGEAQGLHVLEWTDSVLHVVTRSWDGAGFSETARRTYGREPGPLHVP